MAAIITVKHLTKRFKGKDALSGIDFNLNKGEIFGFLGPSGAGKTTTINILTGQLTPDSGEAQVFGKSSQELKPEDFEQIGIMSDTVGFYGRMTLYENLEFFARFHDRPMSEVDDYLERLDLYDDRLKKAEKLSTGMKQRMLLIRALLHKPRLLFLDEPTSGLDPVMAQKVHELLKEVKAQGTTIFLTTHNMLEATELCDNIALLYKGNIVEHGAPQAIIDKYNTSDQVELHYYNGRTKRISKEELADYMSSEVASVHTLEANLATIFIQLTGESLDEKIN